MTTPTPRWLWVRPEARQALSSRNVGAILACYRRMTGLSQVALAERLGYDPSYISLLERGRRTMTDRTGLAYLSRSLAIPHHALGISTEDDADFQAALQFGDSTVRLAEIARQAAALAHTPVEGAAAPAPQWRAIERTTTGHALLTIGDTRSGLAALFEALDVAAQHRLPHQVQRILRTARTSEHLDLYHHAEESLRILRHPALPGAGP